MENKTCGECRYFETEHCKLKGIGWKFATDTPCSGFTPRKVITNGDVIRQMSNEELAVMFRNEIDQCPPGECHDDGCIECWLAWLNAPADAPDINVGTMAESEVKNV